jgi:oxygen-independent coproporphyrinogen III oxidase
MDNHAIEVDRDLIARLDRNGPRYTSYPTADRFLDSFDAQAYAAWTARRNLAGAPRPLSLYVHLPFCSSLCYYCACNKVVTQDAAKGAKYLRYLRREIALQAALFAEDARVGQMHWGGGTPTFYALDDLEALHRTIASHFELDQSGEYSIEIDPRTVTAQTLPRLREMGFNRVSFGVQDFEPAVQRAINRVQDERHTLGLIDAARACGFVSVNVDLIYGLPLQTSESFSRTLERVAAMRPDRLAVYSYAHLPARFKSQKLIAEAALPSAQAKLRLLELAVQRLTAAGYVYIGMDHFALPGDALAAAQAEGRLNRNFQGYSTQADCDLVGLGVSAIGAIGPTYSQNARTLGEYYQRLDANQVPIARGVALTRDDLVRRSVIQALICQFAVSKGAVGAGYLIDFDDYFAPELGELRGLERERLLSLEPEWITVTPKGRLLIRSICMVFDRYLRNEPDIRRYSRTI